MGFPLSIVTPEKVAWESQVDSLVIPAYEGEMGILPGHAPLLTQLTPGVVKIRSGEEERLLSVSGGFVEVFGGHVSLFAETAEMAEEVDAERARQATERAKAALVRRHAEPLDMAQAEGALRRALARQKAANMVRRRMAGEPKRHS